MNRLILTVIPVLLLGACDAARPSPVTSSSEPGNATMQPAASNQATTETCDVLVSFTSICCGVNQPVQTRINDLVASDSRVSSVKAHPWGREGEVDLCIRTHGAADAAGLIRDIQAIIASGQSGPPVSVLAGGKPQVGFTAPVDLSTDQRLPGT